MTAFRLARLQRRPVSIAVRVVRRWRTVSLAVAGAVALLAGMVLVFAPASSAASTAFAVTEVPVAAATAGSVTTDQTTDTVYAATSSPPGVAVLDGATNAVTGQISLPFAPTLVTADPVTDTVYAFSEPADVTAVATLDVINAATNAVTATISLPAGIDPNSAAVNSETGTVYLTDSHGNVLVISGSTVTATIPLADPVLAPDASPRGVAVDAATDTIYVADYENSQVAVIDGATNTVTDRIALPAGSVPIGVALDQAAGLVYVADEGTGAISVIDAATDSVSSLTTGLWEPRALALDPGTGTLYAVSLTSGPATANVVDPGVTYAIDTSSGAIEDQIPRGGYSAALTPASGGSLYMAGGTGTGGDLTVMTPSAANTMSPVIIGGVVDPSVVLGQSLQDQFAASATPAATFSATGLPDGLTMSPSGLLSGTPTAVGTYSLTVTAANGVAPAYSETGTVTVAEAPDITSADQVTFETGVPNSFTVTATGYPAPGISETGALPAGVSNSNGLLSGTPAAGTEGVYPIQFSASNVAGTVSQSFTLTVIAPTYAVGVEGTTGALYAQAPQLSAGWHSLGGQISGPPAMVALPNEPGTSASVPESPLFIATGNNELLYERLLTGGWEQVGPVDGSCLGSPAAVITNIDGTTTLIVACEGTNNQLYYHLAGVPSAGALPVFDSGWTSLGGVLTAPPAVATVDGVITFFVRGTNGRIYTRTLTSGYTETPWACVGAPAAAQQATTGITVFACEGTNDALWEATSSGGGWTAAVSLGGALIGSPAIAASSEQIEFFAEGTTHAVYERTTATGWVSIGGSAVGGAGATALS